MDMDFENKNFVFLGIGGISMSALARMVFTLKGKVFGSDLCENDQIKQLKNDKIAKIKISNVPSYVKNADFVIYTNAIKENNPDLVLAKHLNKKIFERATFLGILSCKFKNLIAVSGTHGKTTTTSLLGWIFETAKRNPTVHIGGISKNFQTNVKIGGKNFFITEACEYRKSFLQLNPTTTLINNIEFDHPDFYKNFTQIQSAFIQLSHQTKNNLVINGDLLSKKTFQHRNIITFGFKKSNNLYANRIIVKNGQTSFNIIYNHRCLGRVCTTLLGKHNILNILAATTVALIYQVDFSYIQQAIKTFAGTERRFETVWEKDYKMILDYAHHPTEIACTINSAKTIEHNSIIAIFQPHTYSRTLELMNEFKNCFFGVDKLFILPTYAAREKEILGGRAIDLFYEVKNVKETQYFSNISALFHTLDASIQKGDIVLWIGAGNIENFTKEYVKKLKEM